MWEHRYGFPDPARTASGYRMYTPAHVDTLRRVVAYRGRGLSVPAALERAQAAEGPTDRPSLFGAIASGAGVQPQRLHKRTLLAISRGIEDETIARAAGPVVIASFQEERNYRASESRYRRLNAVADECVIFGGFETLVVEPGEPQLIPVEPEGALGNEWAVIVDAPGYAACLVAWETPEPGRVFEGLWTLDPVTVRRAALVGAALARRRAPEVGERLEELLQDRPLAMDSAVALTALANRIVGYLER